MSLLRSPTLSPSSPQPPNPPPSHIPPPWYTYHASTASSAPFVSLPSLLSSSKTSTPLFLTPLQTTDAPSVQRIHSSPLVSSRLLSVPFPYTLADAESWIALHHTSSAPCLPLQAIRLHQPNEDGQLIGAASLAKRDEAGTYELGYYLDPDWHGLGIMRNAVLAVLSWAGQEEGAKAVLVRVETSNEGSRRVVESIPGFVRQEDEDVDWKGTPKVVRVWRLRFE